jgi:hypothetical protein
MWVFASGSNPNKTHETLQYNDGSTSCGCPGWTRRCTADGYRTCRHTRSIDAGTADSECVSMVDYTKGKMQGKLHTAVSVPPVVSKVRTKVSIDDNTEAPLKRKIRW